MRVNIKNESYKKRRVKKMRVDFKKMRVKISEKKMRVYKKMSNCNTKDLRAHR